MAWRILACRSRQGAEHRRRGVPGQDSVAQGTGRSCDGEPVWVLALADGHGHRRHWLSAVGSAEACRVAVLTISRWLAGLELRTAGLAALGDWQRQLATDLARRIHSRWLVAVRRHWRRQQLQVPQPPEGQPLPYGAEPYGCTLAVLVLTPRWWAVSGLGDWDLVGLDRHGQAVLLSEERPPDPGLETTASLCQADAVFLMAARTQLRPLATGEPIALLLSSDGVRKSCGATADYLTWAAAVLRTMIGEGPTTQSQPVARPDLSRLSDLPGLQRLDLQLDQLSALGTGDDVSVLAVSHGPLAWLPGPDPAAVSPSPQRLPRGRRAAGRMRPPQDCWPGRLVRRLLKHRRMVLVSVLLLAALVLIPALVGLLSLLGG